MRCPNCGAEIQEGSGFCSRCGTPIEPSGQAGSSLTKTMQTPGHAMAFGAALAEKYKIFEEIGRGGMGIVYKAEDIRLQRTVALKFLPPQISDDPDFKERFLIEARAVAALSHPNICVIHEVGEDEERPYIAMEYVEGETLRDRIRRKPLTPEEIVDLTSQIAAGLSEAHGKGIIHRDIKSVNIMITDKGLAKIMDFGLAKIRGGGTSLTRTQMTLGTVAYMSPEQALGGDIDHRSDLWSLGVVLYEMLAGELPFKGEHDVSIIHSILHEEPKSLKIRKTHIPVELQQVVSRALKKNPDARYSSAEDILKELKVYEKSLSGIPSVKTLIRRFRRPAVMIPAILLVAVISAGIFFILKHRDRVRWARNEAIPEIERMIENTDLFRDLIPAYRLAEQIETVLGNDPKLQELFSKISKEINIVTKPLGARAYIKEYQTPDAEWTYLGLTPLEKIRVPMGMFRWKFEKEDYTTVLAAGATFDVKEGRYQVPIDVFRILDRTDSIPEGMVRIQGEKTAAGPIEDFFIDQFEVTNRKFKEFVDAGGYKRKEFWKYPFIKEGRELTLDEAVSFFVDETDRPGPLTWQAGDYPEGRDDYPVRGISWYEAAAYAEYAGKSLPTNAHWSLASGTSTPMFNILWGLTSLASFSNFTENAPVQVGILQGITSYGVYDMAGNVWEWCWNETPAGRSIRGGSYGENIYEFLAVRQAAPMDRSPKNGFRCVVYPDGTDMTAQAFQFTNISTASGPPERDPIPDNIFNVYKEYFSYDRTELHADVVLVKEHPDWMWEKVTFDAAYGGDRMMAHLFLPKNTSPPFQTVIYFPGSSSRLWKSSENIDAYVEFDMFISFILKNGRAVLYPVYWGTYERKVSGITAVDRKSHALSDFIIKIVKDFRRSIDYLETREDIDSTKIAFYGMSLGGNYGAIIPAVEDRVKASVLIAGVLSWGRQPKVDFSNYAPRVKIPTLMLNGKYDFNLETKIKPFFKLLGTSEKHKELKLYDTAHLPPRNEFMKETLLWLDKYLGPVK